MTDLFYELYGRIHCPQCKAVNWWYAGRHPTDETYPDTDALRCHPCQHLFLLMEEDLFEDLGHDSIEDCGVEDGLPQPRL